LADARRRIAVMAQKLRSSESTLLDQRRSPRRQDVALEPRSPAVATRQQRIACRRADRRRRMGIGEPHSFARQPIENRRRYLRLRIEAADVTITEVIRQDEHNVRPCRIGCGAERQTSNKEEEKGGEDSIHGATELEC